MIDRIRDFARPIPLVRQKNLTDLAIHFYSKSLNQLDPNLFVEEGRKRYLASPDNLGGGPDGVGIMLAHSIQQFTHDSPNITVEIPFTSDRSRFHYLETSDWSQAIPYFCHQLYARIAEAAKVHDAYKPALDGGFMNWSQVTHIGHPIQFIHREFAFPSLLFNKHLYTSSDDTVCHGQAFFAPSIGGEKVWVRFRKNKLARCLPGFVNDNFITAQLMCVPGGTRLFAFLHKGHDEEARLYLASLALLEEGSYVLLNEQQKRLALGDEKDGDGFVKWSTASYTAENASNRATDTAVNAASNAASEGAASKAIDKAVNAAVADSGIKRES